MRLIRTLCFATWLLLVLPQAITAQHNERKASPGTIADSLNQLGVALNDKGDHAGAEPLFQQAIALCRKHKLNKNLGQGLYNLSSLYADTANYETAIELGEEAVGLLLKHKDGENAARCLINLKICWSKHGKFIMAMVYADSAVNVSRTLKNDMLLERALCHQGEIYKDINTARAIPMLKEALALAKRASQWHDLDNIYSLLGQCYVEPYMEIYDAAVAERYHRMALEASLAHAPASVNNNRIWYGKMCMRNGKYEEARYQLRLVYEAALAAKNNDDLTVASFCLSEVYFGMKDFSTAYRYLKEAELLNEKYYAAQKKGTDDKMAFNFKTGRIETQHKLLKQERELQRVKLEQESFRKNVKIVISLAVTLFLVVVSVLLVKFFRKKNVLLSKKSNILRQQLLLTQISPHFITSSISSIQSLIREEKPDAAATYLSKFARLTRQILENSTGDYIALDEEIAMITNYLTVQLLLHPEGFSFTVDDGGMDTEAIYLPPMLTQPLIANAVKRVVQSGSSRKFIDVLFRMKNNRLLFEVCDTGGPLQPGEESGILQSAAVSITVERLAALHMHAPYLTVMNLVGNGGVRDAAARLELPYITDD
ncbi:tetratricopeptide repeat protein [uncultured Flavobacterium sp.]|uniref:tetratricopeptide repeat protein n=1 Tax=uncultured Flavobacterium sp. TaxID=165435 RepID=UPI0025FBE71B|nr:tetratricopeptide repeat protein [uncultured Flavobacterium sp.]